MFCITHSAFDISPEKNNRSFIPKNEEKKRENMFISFTIFRWMIPILYLEEDEERKKKKN